jgi:hypothetical protein
MADQEQPETSTQEDGDANEPAAKKRRMEQPDEAKALKARLARANRVKARLRRMVTDAVVQDSLLPLARFDFAVARLCVQYVGVC